MADSNISSRTNPPSTLYDISLSGAKGKGEIIELLKLINDGDFDKISPGTFERLSMLFPYISNPGSRGQVKSPMKFSQPRNPLDLPINRPKHRQPKTPSTPSPDQRPRKK